SDGAGVAFPVLMPADAERGFSCGVLALVGQDGGVRNSLDQAGSEGGSGDAEGEIVLCRRCRKVGLGNLAAAGVDGAGDREESVNDAVPNGVRGWIRKLETGFADRTVQGDKRRHGVGGALQRRDRNLRIDGRARASNCRLRMTSGTTVQIKSWAESG